ncbi:MAG: encapsulin-associated ferritin-like protein [Bacillota bacterium]
MSNYVESLDQLGEDTKDIVRALHSLKEEVEAVIWYHQRVDASDDDTLKEILEHNRDEEIEHVCMVLEWLRRNMPGWDKELRTFLFTEGSIGEAEEHGEEHGTAIQPDGSLNLGGLKK